MFISMRAETMINDTSENMFEAFLREAYVPRGEQIVIKKRIYFAQMLDILSGSLANNRNRKCARLCEFMIDLLETAEYPDEYCDLFSTLAYLNIIWAYCNTLLGQNSKKCFEICQNYSSLIHTFPVMYIILINNYLQQGNVTKAREIMRDAFEKITGSFANQKCEKFKIKFHPKCFLNLGCNTPKYILFIVFAYSHIFDLELKSKYAVNWSDKTFVKDFEVLKRHVEVADAPKCCLGYCYLFLEDIRLKITMQHMLSSNLMEALERQYPKELPVGCHTDVHIKHTCLKKWVFINKKSVNYPVLRYKGSYLHYTQSYGRFITVEDGKTVEICNEQIDPPLPPDYPAIRVRQFAKESNIPRRILEEKLSKTIEEKIKAKSVEANLKTFLKFQKFRVTSPKKKKRSLPKLKRMLMLAVLPKIANGLAVIEYCVLQNILMRCEKEGKVCKLAPGLDQAVYKINYLMMFIINQLMQAKSWIVCQQVIFITTHVWKSVSQIHPIFKKIHKKVKVSDIECLYFSEARKLFQLLFKVRFLSAKLFKFKTENMATLKKDFETVLQRLKKPCCVDGTCKLTTAPLKYESYKFTISELTKKQSMEANCECNACFLAWQNHFSMSYLLKFAKSRACGANIQKKFLMRQCDQAYRAFLINVLGFQALRKQMVSIGTQTNYMKFSCHSKQTQFGSHEDDAAVEKKVTKMTSRIEYQNEMIKDYEEQINNLKKAQKIALKSLKKAETSKPKLESSVKSLEEKMSSMQKKIDQLELENKDLTTKNEVLEKQLKEKEKLEKDFRKLKTAHEDLDAKFKSKCGAYNELIEKWRGYKTEYDAKAVFTAEEFRKLNIKTATDKQTQMVVVTNFMYNAITFINHTICELHLKIERVILDVAEVKAKLLGTRGAPICDICITLFETLKRYSTECKQQFDKFSRSFQMRGIEEVIQTLNIKTMLTYIEKILVFLMTAYCDLVKGTLNLVMSSQGSQRSSQSTTPVNTTNPSPPVVPKPVTTAVPTAVPTGATRRTPNCPQSRPQLDTASNESFFTSASTSRSVESQKMYDELFTYGLHVENNRGEYDGSIDAEAQKILSGLSDVIQPFPWVNKQALLAKGRIVSSDLVDRYCMEYPTKMHFLREMFPGISEEILASALHFIRTRTSDCILSIDDGQILVWVQDFMCGDD